jgi:TonB-dependent starch-binding outer membrane protein SusC
MKKTLFSEQNKNLCSYRFASSFFLLLVMLSCSLFATAKEYRTWKMLLPPTVTGTITSDEGEALPGVSIVVKGTTIGTTTDINGKYTIDVPSSGSVLVFSFTGYLAEEVVIENQTTVDLKLTPDLQSLSEVVVVGYGTQKRATLTGSISEVKGAEIVKSPQPNLSNSLAGRFSGLIATNRGGEPGYDKSDIYIRGISTTGNRDVLVVVDGVPGQVGGFERLDPNDIESISVLKDASAAVYGSRAANGVILVTTKRGTTGKPTVSYSFNQGWAAPTRLPDMANAATYATMMNEIRYYSNPTGGFNQFYSAEEIEKFRNGSDPVNYPNQDWIKSTLKKTAPQRQHNLSVNGGTQNVKYFVSLGTLFQDGLYKNGANKYNQYNLRANIDANITDRFKIGLSLSGRQENREFPSEAAGDIFRSIYRAKPIVPAVYPNGYPSSGIEGNNPAMMVTDAGGTKKNPNLIFNGILRASYSLPFLDGLSIEGFYALDKGQNSNRNFTTPYLVYDYTRATDTYSPRTKGEPRAILFQSQENTTLSTANIKLNFQRALGFHNVNAFVAYEQSEKSLDHFEAQKRNFPTTQTPELSQGGTDPTDATNAGWSWVERRRSFIGRANYNFKEKYLAEVQLRVDGSSKFAKGKQYGYFPGVSAGWRISEEGFFKNSISFINDLKLRASYGQLGGDNVGSNQFINNFSFNNQYTLGNAVYPGIDLIKLANTNITWEVSKKTDLAISGTVLKNIFFEAIYFKENRENILTARNASVPNVTGIVDPFIPNPANGIVPLIPDENIGEVKNSGVEATLGYSHKGDFNYGVSGNITYAKSEIIFMDEAPNLLAYQKQTGGPLNTQLLYKTIGIFQSEEQLANYPHVPGAKTGDLIYEDLGGPDGVPDGVINGDDRIRTDLGNIPQLTFGINLNAGYKNFDFSALFAGQGKVRQYLLAEGGTDGNYFSTWADNRWSPSNTGGTYPRLEERASGAISGGRFKNDFWLQNTAFIRLKNIEVGYSFPEELLSKIKMQNLRIYANAFNVFTITKAKDVDPESSSESGQFYPQQRIFNLGLNVKF